jgi:hypothetical protein
MTITNIDTYLIKIQSYILKNVISLLPILMDSKRFSNKTIAEFYIGFLCSKFCLNTKFLSKLINSRLFEIQESRNLIIEPLCKTLSKMILLETSEERHVIDARLESIGRLFTELMNVLEKKDIVSLHFHRVSVGRLERPWKDKIIPPKIAKDCTSNSLKTFVSYLLGQCEPGSKRNMHVFTAIDKNFDLFEKSEHVSADLRHCHHFHIARDGNKTLPIIFQPVSFEPQRVEFPAASVVHERIVNIR